eukprot:TRINITY_DN29595_c0_g1_i1.p1 TRINITY_DN29595_c0_g1~~TRINITY_DN29595_c0_g1_i1.p1  ORF type:complete len:349 (-),score=39.58 TRINITY_DN29595_c0_g1_i1:203-1249(-)
MSLVLVHCVDTMAIRLPRRFSMPAPSVRDSVAGRNNFAASFKTPFSARLEGRDTIRFVSSSERKTAIHSVEHIRAFSRPQGGRGELRPLSSHTGLHLSMRRLFPAVNCFPSRRNISYIPRASSSSGGSGRGGLVGPLELANPERGMPPPLQQPQQQYNGVFLLLLINVAFFVADQVFHLPLIHDFYLYHANPRWYQFVTSAFCHVSWSHLSGNLFFVYLFGKLVEELEGGFGVVASYLLTAVGGNLVSWLLLPSSYVSLGASGAVFGLFAVSVLIRLTWDWRKILEVMILGPYVVDRVIMEAQESALLVSSPGTTTVNHVGHLAGALVGAMLIYLVTRIPDPANGKGR